MAFLYSNWLKLNLSTRQKIAQAFNISKTLPTHVVDNRLVQDGYPIHDVETNINTPAIQEYLHCTDKNEDVLWDKLVARMEGRDVPADEIAAIVSEPTLVNSVVVAPPAPKPPKKKAAPKKKK